ncbi:MAG: glycoside hydrolase family 97 protein [Rhizobacter sp.]|nr:glycoside hydrolase family 97 protein [Ferruginibacter sp.]
MKYLLSFLLLIFSAQVIIAQKKFVLWSPDSSLRLEIANKEKISYTLYAGNTELMASQSVNIQLDNGKQLSGNAVKRSSVNIFTDSFQPPAAYRRKVYINKYRQLEIQFKESFAIQFRLYNNGMAYRIETSFIDSIRVLQEDASFDIDPEAELWFAHIDKRADVDKFHTSFEGRYKKEKLSKLPDSLFTYAPVTIALPNSKYLLAISDANLNEYPGMFLSPSVKGLKGIFAGYPAKEKMNEGEFPQSVVTARENFIARTKGKRMFPWRVILFGKNDVDLVENDLIYILGDAPAGDFSWVKPAKGTDEWITGINLFDVPFKAGINTNTYKYYIDFAKRFGFDQIMLDAGWSDVKDLFKINPDLDIEELVQYARSKQIKLMLWTLCSTLEKQLDSALKQFSKWNVHAIMTDFMDRDDQKTVNFYHRIAKACAANKIAVMFHGAFPPKGFNRTWPNALTHEGVLGAEFNIWSSDATPEHNVAIAYTRMLAGPLDYEPGLLLNAQPDQFKAISKNPMSIGTRSHQLAMFVVYDSPLQIFSGNISQGLREPAFMELLGSIPAGWDETKVLQGSIGKFIVTARRKGKDWFIAGLNNNEERTIGLPLNFLPGKKYSGKLCVDGTNANSYAGDYEIRNFGVNLNDIMKLQMAKGGGFLIKLVAE